MNPKVDELLSKAKNWPNELALLRKILLQSQLTEEIKWGSPCYTFQGNNILMLHGFKAFCAVSFFKGALLKDSESLLVKPGENTQLGRQIQFTQLQEIKKMSAVIQAYIKEAIEVEQKGIKQAPANSSENTIPIEFQEILNKNTILRKAFEKLTPGRQRAYLLYFSAPKQSGTKITRIEKYTQQIINGKGINDCTCGLSKKMPGCDGSHKLLHTIKTPH